MDQFAKIRFSERLAFAGSDFGNNLVYGAVSAVYSFFLTDYFGLPAYYCWINIKNIRCIGNFMGFEQH